MYLPFSTTSHPMAGLTGQIDLPPLTMKKIHALKIVAVLLALAGGAATRAAEPASSPFAPLAFLAGKVWRAELPPMPNGAKAGIELHADWTENHQAVRFESAWMSAGKSTPYTSGMYAWNPAKKQLVILYSDAEGSLTEGTISIEGEVLVHELTVNGKDGKLTRVRSRITPRGPEAYTNEIFLLKNDVWEKFVDLRYERVSGGSASAGK